MGSASSKVEQSLKVEAHVFASDERAEDDTRWRRKSKPNTELGRVPNAIEGEQVAAGWPSWLAAVAGEALIGWIPRTADSYEKIDKIGDGSYSYVYKARDMLSGKIVALKKVRFDPLKPESIRFMVREILIMRRLNHPNIIKLEGLVISRMSAVLYLVLEYMEHDLTGIASRPGVRFTEPQVKCYMKQLFSGLQHCHTRGVLHRDMKCSNLLINDSGILKIADFGLSTFFDYRKDWDLTSRVVTLWYRPPELLLGQTRYGVAVDLWGTGCILGELYAGKPIMPGRTEVEQLHKIFKLCGSPSEDYWKKSQLPHATVFKPQVPYKRCLADTFKDFPTVALHLLDTLLSIDPEDRGTADSVLQSEFFTTEPFASDPLSLPKYPPSKEADVERRELEANRQGIQVASRINGLSKIMHAPLRPDADADADLAVSKQHHFDSKETKNGFYGAFNNLDRMLEEHERQIKKAVQKARSDKRRIPAFSNIQKAPGENATLSNFSSNDETKVSETYSHLFKGNARKAGGERREERVQSPVTSTRVFSSPVSAESYDMDLLLEEHDRHVQEFAQRLRLEKRRAGLKKGM